MAEMFYKKSIKKSLKEEEKDEEKWKLAFSGNGFGGALAQYTAVTSEESMYQYQCVALDSVGI